jgi:hypothetical protein
MPVDHGVVAGDTEGHADAIGNDPMITTGGAGIVDDPDDDNGFP